MKITLLLIISLTTILASCGPQVIMTPNAFSSFNKGDQLNYWEDSEYIPEFVYNFPNVNDEKNITVYVNKVYHYYYASQYGYSDRNGYSYGLFAYDDKTLFYWGYLDDFLRSDNDLIRAIGELTADKIATEDVAFNYSYKKYSIGGRS